MTESELKGLKIGDYVERQVIVRDTPLLAQNIEQLCSFFNSLMVWQVIGKDGDLPIIALMLSTAGFDDGLYDVNGNEVPLEKVLNGGVFYDDDGSECLVTECGCELSDLKRNGLLEKDDEEYDDHILIRAMVVHDGRGWEKK